ncbi:zinc finger protein 706 [Aplysia californica]|uniref:Zinc finger protein 706 n=1 Tax=Aplysia californica TaxID=6500 RepID=A0ABM0K4W0_APLCA|nr:zinc finger protein 706 [Aplysia californica]
MARGQQKIQSQQKAAAKKAADAKKGGSFQDQKKAAAKALTHSCPVCKALMPDPKTFKQHFENKHPKAPLPPELQEV